MKTTKKLIFITMCLLFTLNANSQKYKLVWADEFNGKGLPDSTKWGYEDGYIRNNELQYYTRSTNNVRQYKGNLEITVCKEPMKGFEYTSASVISQTKGDFKYGKIEGRFKIPSGKGLWACFWTLGSNFPKTEWPSCGEIDIFEHINSETIIHGTAHWADESGKHVGKGANFYNIDVTKWHTYSIVWTPTTIKWYVDKFQYHEIYIDDVKNSTEEYHKPHYILINLPIGGGWPGSPDATTVLPATMYCDYIRVYQAIPSEK